MDAIPVLRATAYRPIVDKLRLMGVPVDAHLERLGVPPDALDHQDRLLPERPLWELIDLVHRREGVEDLGFQIGASHRVTDIENFRPLLAGHPTLLKMILAFCSGGQTHNNYWEFRVARVPGGVLLCRGSSPIDVGRWPLEQYAVSYLVDLVRMAAPRSWWPREIWLQTPLAPRPSERRWLRGARLHLGSRATAIPIPDSLLGRRPASSPRPGAPGLEMDPIPKAFVPVFREVVQSLFLAGRPSLRDMGKATGLHPRTLQRVLTQAGTSFREVLDDVRLEMACARLEDGVEAVTVIAGDLGYQDVPAFSRAFRHWTGVSPRAYRKANRAHTE